MNTNLTQVVIAMGLGILPAAAQAAISAVATSGNALLEQAKFPPRTPEQMGRDAKRPHSPPSRVEGQVPKSLRISNRPGIDYECRPDSPPGVNDGKFDKQAFNDLQHIFTTMAFLEAFALKRGLLSFNAGTNGLEVNRDITFELDDFPEFKTAEKIHSDETRTRLAKYLNDGTEINQTTWRRFRKWQGHSVAPTDGEGKAQIGYYIRQCQDKIHRYQRLITSAAIRARRE